MNRMSLVTYTGCGWDFDYLSANLVRRYQSVVSCCKLRPCGNIRCPSSGDMTGLLKLALSDA